MRHSQKKGSAADWAYAIFSPMNSSKFQRRSPIEKALTCNLDKSIYGAFAEIGAGQEVANLFFKAGNASGTIAKTMSAYDMTVSDSIYGKEKSGRYVCESRLVKMLDHEYSRLSQRLAPKIGKETKFFTFANTVTTRTQGPNRYGHGWVGIRFQTRPGGPENSIFLHVRLLDHTAIQQREALALFGVNLVYGAFYRLRNPHAFIDSLTDNLKRSRIEIDLIRFEGKDLAHIDSRLMCLYLVEKDLTNAVCFDSDGRAVLANDLLYGKPVVLQRGTFRPVTNNHINVKKLSMKQFSTDFDDGKPVPIMEITMQSLSKKGKIDPQDFLDRVDLISATGHAVLVSRFYLYFQITNYLRERTQLGIAISMSAKHLKHLFTPKYYEALPGGILEGLGRITHGNNIVYVHEEIRGDQATNIDNFKPAKSVQGLFEHLRSSNKLIHIGSPGAQETIHSDDVVGMIKTRDKKWKSSVPEDVARVIEKRKLFRD